RDLVVFARDLAGFVVALRGVDASGGPAAGAHCFHRGGSLRVYDAETREAIAALGPRVDAAAATDAWKTALDAPWTGPPVWDVRLQDGTSHSRGHPAVTGDLFDPACPTRELLDRIGDKWTSMLVKVLAEADPPELGFAELARRAPGISHKMLSQTLRNL